MEQVFEMFDKEIATSQTYCEFLRNLKQDCENNLEFRVKKAQFLRGGNFYMFYIQSISMKSLMKEIESQCLKDWTKIKLL